MCVRRVSGLNIFWGGHFLYVAELIESFSINDYDVLLFNHDFQEEVP